MAKASVGLFGVENPENAPPLLEVLLPPPKSLLPPEVVPPKKEGFASALGIEPRDGCCAEPDVVVELPKRPDPDVVAGLLDEENMLPVELTVLDPPEPNKPPERLPVFEVGCPNKELLEPPLVAGAPKLKGAFVDDGSDILNRVSSNSVLFNLVRMMVGRLNSYLRRNNATESGRYTYYSKRVSSLYL